MGITDIIKLIELGAQAIQTGYALYNDAHATLSETDRAKVQQALALAQAQTDMVRAQVDAALTKAAQK